MMLIYINQHNYSVKNILIYNNIIIIIRVIFFQQNGVFRVNDVAVFLTL